MIRSSCFRVAFGRLMSKPLLQVIPTTLLTVLLIRISLVLYSAHTQQFPTLTETMRTSEHRESFLHRDVKPTPMSKLHKSSLFEEAIRRNAKNYVIILIFTDEAGLNMLLNFYITSLRTFNISNFLVVTSGKSVCERLHDMNLPCFHYKNETNSNKTSTFGTRDFKEKMDVRTDMIIEALGYGYNVLHTDSDVHFFRDPRDDILRECSDSCDIAPLWDCGAHNAGFLYIRSTPRSIALYKSMDRRLVDQLALNKAISKHKKLGLKLRQLPPDKYLCGKSYYDNGGRSFAGDNPCSKCIVVHNNWIVTADAKIYRAREMHQWLLDGPAKYYSDPARKYIVYSNPLWFGDITVTWEQEKIALINALALGEILNRTVILPRFVCKTQKESSCSLLNHICIKPFDDVFGDKYRESTFLSHPLVSPAVITSKLNAASVRESFKIDDLETSTKEDIVSWFGQEEASVLVFPSLYGEEAPYRASFAGRTQAAFKEADRLQFCETKRTSH